MANLIRKNISRILCSNLLQVLCSVNMNGAEFVHESLSTKKNLNGKKEKKKESKINL